MAPSIDTTASSSIFVCFSPEFLLSGTRKGKYTTEHRTREKSYRQICMTREERFGWHRGTVIMIRLLANDCLSRAASEQRKTEIQAESGKASAV